jgi:hypothetical protein
MNQLEKTRMRPRNTKSPKPRNGLWNKWNVKKVLHGVCFIGCLTLAGLSISSCYTSLKDPQQRTEVLKKRKDYFALCLSKAGKCGAKAKTYQETDECVMDTKQCIAKAEYNTQLKSKRVWGSLVGLSTSFLLGLCNVMGLFPKSKKIEREKTVDKMGKMKS